MQLKNTQRGSFIIEAILGILIFLIGILGLIALQGTAISTTTDTRYRVEANQFASRMMSSIQGGANRTSDAAFQNSINAFSHNATGEQCAFSGTASTNATVIAWLSDLQSAATATRLPSADAQIRITWAAAGTVNQVRIIICWQQPGLPVMRRHVVTGSIS